MNTITIVTISVALIAFVVILVFLAMKSEGAGIMCFDACGPCSSYGTFHVMIDGKCVNGPEGSVCSNNAGGRGVQARFFDGRCGPVDSIDIHKIPEVYSNEYVNSNVTSCQSVSEENQVCNPKIAAECPVPKNGNYTWKWGEMYELCFKMRNDSSGLEIPYCDRTFPEDSICDPYNNNYLCPASSEAQGWGYNDLDMLCYRWDSKS
jgi:hypothetical protein